MIASEKLLIIFLETDVVTQTANKSFSFNKSHFVEAISLCWVSFRVVRNIDTAMTRRSCCDTG